MKPQPGNLRAQGGLCKCMPPTAVGIPTPQGLAIQAMFPPMPDNGFCGQFFPTNEISLGTIPFPSRQ